MSIDKRIKQALESVTPPIPVMHGVFVSDAPEYYVFTDTSMGTDYADDAPCAERHLPTVHLFAPLSVNITERKKGTKRALAAAGFTWPSAEDETESDVRHVLFSFEDAEGL